jgi:hypothetical protein
MILALALAARHSGIATESDKGPETPVLRRLPPLDSNKLDPNYSEDWKCEEFSDEKRGIFVHIGEWKEKTPSFAWMTPGEVTVAAVVRLDKNLGRPPEHAATVRVRLTPDTVRYLITTPEAPLLPRYLALRDMCKVEGLSQSERFKLIELASRDVRAEMRCMAANKAGEHTPRHECIPVLCRALCDPSAMVAYNARRPLIKYFFPGDEANREVECFSIAGGPEVVDRHLRSAALVTARRVHEVRRDMVTDDDLATIERLCGPQTEDAIDTPDKASEAKPKTKPEEKPSGKSPKPESK